LFFKKVFCISLTIVLIFPAATGAALTLSFQPSSFHGWRRSRRRPLRPRRASCWPRPCIADENCRAPPRSGRSRRRQGGRRRQGNLGSRIQNLSGFHQKFIEISVRFGYRLRGASLAKGFWALYTVNKTFQKRDKYIEQFPSMFLRNSAAPEV
jgi:hypothetical protein